MRSNSGGLGSTWCDSDTIATSGYSSRITSAARSSWAGLRYEWRKLTAMEVTPKARSRAVAFRTASSSRGVSTSPSAVIRSGTSRRTRRRAIGSGGG